MMCCIAGGVVAIAVYGKCVLQGATAFPPTEAI